MCIVQQKNKLKFFSVILSEKCTKDNDVCYLTETLKYTCLMLIINNKRHRQSFLHYIKILPSPFIVPCELVGNLFSSN